MRLRIGFTYNLRPGSAGRGFDGTGEEEPPSRKRPSERLSDRYAEWDEPATIDAVASALRNAGEVILLEANADLPLALRQANPDIVFNIAEGLRGVSREAQVPAFCEFYGIPYTASDPLTLALALDKQRAKEIFRARGVPTPWSTVLGESPTAGRAQERSDGPWIVKPVQEGSSMGIPAHAYCAAWRDVEQRAREILDEYEQPALVERFLPGREFTIGILGNGASAFALPPVEIRFDALPADAPPIYGYEAKWVWDTAEQPLDIFACPAPVDPDVTETLGCTALAAYHALGCRDWARVDLRLDADGTPNVLEINPLPGILPDPRQNSCLPKAARAAGMTYDDLILSVLHFALERYGMRA
jgi:D-alanine-D-alanine ligase